MSCNRFSSLGKFCLNGLILSNGDFPKFPELCTVLIKKIHTYLGTLCPFIKPKIQKFVPGKKNPIIIGMDPISEFARSVWRGHQVEVMSMGSVLFFRHFSLNYVNHGRELVPGVDKFTLFMSPFNRVDYNIVKIWPNRRL